jgi:predicted Zn finger-like uncharacterized protein
MDVRCEKCQTEYELDESRLKPGGVTVKCTNCGHMFKIRKRTPTNVGVAAQPPAAEPPRKVSPSKPPPAADPAAPRPRSKSDDLGSGPNAERNWLIRLENGEQKSCRELATLQQWIVAGVVTRESLISRSGKTWKRLGDIDELAQYFVIADEAKAQRAGKPTGKVASTLAGYGKTMPAAAAGGTVLPDEDEGRATGNFRVRDPKTTPPPPPPRATPATGSPQPKPNPLAQTELAPSSQPRTSPRPPTQPPPVPRAKPPSVPDNGRNTAMWASNEIKHTESMAEMPQGPLAGRVSAIPDEPAFAGRVRVVASDESSFDTGRVSVPDDDDDLMPVHHGSRAGLWIAIFSLLVIAGAVVTIYVFAFREKSPAKVAVLDGPAQVAAVKLDAAAAVTPPPAIDAAPPAPVVTPLDSARTELTGAVEARMQGALNQLASADDPDSQAMRARLMVAMAQDMDDRAGLVEKPDGDKLRKDAHQLVIDAAPLAQRALKAKADDGAANLAMAEVLRLQGKPARDVRRYLDVAKAKAASDAELSRAAALADARLSAREGKLDDAAKALAALDASDVRVALATALIAFAQNHIDDAKKAVDTVLAQSPDQDAARALQKKLDTAVVKTDPLPPEDHGAGSGSAKRPNPTPTPTPDPNAGTGSYDVLLAKANKLAESNCAKAMELYQKALDIKSQGVEALTGMGYCHLDAKQFASAFSNFRSALVVSPRYEPALGGIAETYQRQGNKDMAIESWRKYLEVYPGSAKAKKQLEILGAGADNGGGNGGGGSAAPPPPTPTPPPAPEGSGGGSG